jgi:lariat debranching enzyme
MASRFVENLDEVPITHPHLNVSLDDILAEESRKRSTSQSSEGSTHRSGSDSPSSPTTSESKMNSLKRRALTLGSKKGRHT